MRLLQLASQALPIGGYSHSHGLESAIERGLVRDEQGVAGWIIDVLRFSIASYETPILHAMADGWRTGDAPRVVRLNEEFVASRETRELRTATLQMGHSMRALLSALPGLPDGLHDVLNSIDQPSLPCVWSGTACAWSIEPLDSMSAYLWSWAENQVLVAMKSVPIGQSAGQRMLLQIGAEIVAHVDSWEPQGKDCLSNYAPGLAILSAQHETQYSRLFRS
jgi:urease accessory protein